MSDSFKDALIKAGVISKDSLEREKEQKRRDKIQKQGPNQFGVHAHHARTDCEYCKKGSSDVEYYEHTNRSVDGKWFCVECADKLWINDSCRKSNQSAHAKSGVFRRQYGPTQVFAKNPVASSPQQNQKPVGNVAVGNNPKPQGQSNFHGKKPFKK